VFAVKFTVFLKCFRSFDSKIKRDIKKVYYEVPTTNLHTILSFFYSSSVNIESFVSSLWLITENNIFVKLIHYSLRLESNSPQINTVVIHLAHKSIQFQSF